MLSFQLTNEGKAIQVDCDKEGLASLISVLKEIEVSETGHVHLRAPSSGGKMLSDKTPWGSPAVGEVVISLGGDN